jgi:hypothetical protein
MATGKIDILVYADWFEISGPKLLGTLAAHQGKGRKTFSFTMMKNGWQQKSHFYLTRILHGIKDNNFQLENPISEFLTIQCQILGGEL